MELKVFIINTYLIFRYLVQCYILLFINSVIVFKNQYLILLTTKSKHLLIIAQLIVNLQHTKSESVASLYHS